MKDVSFINDRLLQERIASVITDIFDLGVMIEKEEKATEKVYKDFISAAERFATGDKEVYRSTPEESK